MRVFFRKQKSAGNDNVIEPEEDSAAVMDRGHFSVISAGTNMAGNIECDGDMLIEGTLRGSIRAQRLTVGLDGVIEGEVSADEVAVRGKVKGPIHARHIHLENGAEVDGDITVTTIAIDTGARLSGAVWQSKAIGRALRAREHGKLGLRRGERLAVPPGGSPAHQRRQPLARRRVVRPVASWPIPQSDLSVIRDVEHPSAGLAVDGITVMALQAAVGAAEVDLVGPQRHLHEAQEQ